MMHTTARADHKELCYAEEAGKVAWQLPYGDCAFPMAGSSIAVFEITFGHQTFSGQFLEVSGQTVFCSGKMSAQRKRSLEESSVIDLDALCSDPPTKEHSVQKKTIDKWLVENDKELNTSIWLMFETAADDCDHVTTLKCTVCFRFRERLQPMQNYRLHSLKVLPVCAHPSSRITPTRTCTYTMVLFEKEQYSRPCEYTPIARALA